MSGELHANGDFVNRTRSVIDASRSPPRMRRARNMAEDRRLRADLSAQFSDHQTDLYVLSARELTAVWRSIQKERNNTEDQTEALFESLTGIALTAIREHTGTVASTVVLTRLAADMHRSGSILGTYRVVQREGRHFIILSGYAGLRRHLNAPVYGISNPKVIRMGVGVAAANAALKSGAVLTLILSPAIRSLEWLFVDQKKSLESVLAHVTTDIVKGFCAAGAAYFIGGALPAATSMAGFAIAAVIPVGIGIAVAIAAGFALNSLDERYGITEKLADALVRCRKDWVDAWDQNRREWERARRDLNYYFGSSRGNLEFIRRLMGVGGGYGF